MEFAKADCSLGPGPGRTRLVFICDGGVSAVAVPVFNVTISAPCERIITVLSATFSCPLGPPSPRRGGDCSCTASTPSSTLTPQAVPCESLTVCPPDAFCAEYPDARVGTRVTCVCAPTVANLKQPSCTCIQYALLLSSSLSSISDRCHLGLNCEAVKCAAHATCTRVSNATMLSKCVCAEGFTGDGLLACLPLDAHSPQGRSLPLDFSPLHFAFATEVSFVV